MRIKDQDGTALTTAVFQINGKKTFMLGIRESLADAPQSCTLDLALATQLIKELEEFRDDHN